MEEFYDLLLQTGLFKDITPFGLSRMFKCFSPAVRKFKKGEILMLAGFETKEVGILLQGEADTVKTTPDGTNVSITTLKPGSVFGDVLAGCSAKSPVTVLARSSCTAMYLSCDKMLTPCAAMHPEHLQLLHNLVHTISLRYLSLSDRLDLLVLKSLRAKLCAYLLEQAELAGADTFSVPLSRAGLAEYLNCERSALCRELSRMRDEGLIETYKNSFKLLDKAAIKQQYEL